MNADEFLGLVPAQRTGAPIKATSSQTLASVADAQIFFNKVRDRLMDVNRWHELSGAAGATFTLFDESGEPLQHAVQKGDYIRIDIPGPGPKSGAGYDWVTVEELDIVSNPKLAGFRVRPARDPRSNSAEIAHFYSAESTSTFIIEQLQETVTATVYDSNTTINRDASTTTDQIRNAVVGAGGIAAFSKLQWKKLTDALVGE